MLLIHNAVPGLDSLQRPHEAVVRSLGWKRGTWEPSVSSHQQAWKLKQIPLPP